MVLPNWLSKIRIIIYQISNFYQKYGIRIIILSKTNATVQIQYIPFNLPIFFSNKRLNRLLCIGSQLEYTVLLSERKSVAEIQLLNNIQSNTINQ